MTDSPLQPSFKNIEDVLLVGVSRKMSIMQNTTRSLWQNFMPILGRIGNRVGTDLYSVEVYGGVDYFKKFDPHREFDKWAAVPVHDHHYMPAGMDSLIIPGGSYAVFKYRGRESEVGETYRYIYAQWLPNSGYTLDDRPHFAVMGAGYKGEHPDSQEEIWIPLRQE